MEIIRGTTPTITFTFSTVRPSDIDEGYLVIKKRDTVLLKRSIDYANIDTNSISFTLTQADTLALDKEGQMTIVLDWLTVGGVRGRSKKVYFTTSDSGVMEAI